MPSAIIIPTYNERENIERLVKEIRARLTDARVIIVDDNSPDGTGKVVDALAQRDACVYAVHRPGKLGLGTAHIAGMRRAFELNADPILTMDADFSHDPRYLPELLAALEHFDVVIGSRYVRGGGMEGRDRTLRLVSWGANLFARTMLGLQAHDCTAGFRAYRRAVLDSIELNRIFSNGYSFLIEMLFLCQMHGWRIGEVPIIYHDRQLGQSKISRAEIYKATYTVMRLAYRRLRMTKNKLLERLT
jgi:glycosyltransferase involved in cell wall biosynthesis